jgi:hypothetical protein
MIAVTTFVLGLGVGLLIKGVNIHIIHKKDVDKPKEYNPSLAHLLPPETQNYYNNTNGQNRF